MQMEAQTSPQLPWNTLLWQTPAEFLINKISSVFVCGGGNVCVFFLFCMRLVRKLKTKPLLAFSFRDCYIFIYLSFNLNDMDQKKYIYSKITNTLYIWMKATFWLLWWRWRKTIYCFWIVINQRCKHGSLLKPLGNQVSRNESLLLIQSNDPDVILWLSWGLRGHGLEMRLRFDLVSEMVYNDAWIIVWATESFHVKSTILLDHLSFSSVCQVWSWNT